MQFSRVKPNDRESSTNAATPTILVSDANMIGGGTVPAAGNYVTVSGTIYTDLLTQPHAWAARAFLNPPSGGNYNAFGPSLDATGAAASYARLASYDFYDPTHLVIEFFRPGAVDSLSFPTSFVLDGREHWYGMALDTTGTWYALVDGVIVGSTIDISNVIGAAADDSGLRCWAMFGQTGDANAVGELIYGWVPPTLLDTPDDFSFRSGISKIGFLGDSNFAGSPNPTFRVQAAFEHSITQKFRTANGAFPTFVNLGVAADTSTDVLARNAATIAAACDHYVHLYGLNDDFNHGGAPITPATTQANYTAIIGGILTALPNSRHHVVSNIYSASEMRPRGAGPNDAATDATNAGIVAAVAGLPANRVRYLDFIPRFYTSFSPVMNPGNAANGFITQADGSHYSKTRGQNIWGRSLFDRSTFAW